MGRHRTPDQEAFIVNFMTAHPDKAKGYVKGDKVLVAKDWDEICGGLNGMGPPTKSVEEWRPVWKDWKAAIRGKLAKNKGETRATDGSSCKIEPLVEGITTKAIKKGSLQQRRPQ
ncbi:uncharacterized protein LOC111519630 [Drosophila willistoni]|uniref:uncharacterized protein LOC111519630 n=1 Tax=Drosophila willistoni TaxID=7260 RepID=UPI00017D9DB6|nr:uncharacterized protein LOC111519630 [Drosophila willistoni]